MKKLVLAIVVMALAGCGSIPLNHPYVKEKDGQSDCKQCIQA